jgi:hypothetical protein
LVVLTYPTVGESPKSLVMVDITKSLDVSIELTLPNIEYVVSNAPTNDAPEDIVYEFVASLIIYNVCSPLFSSPLVIFCADADVIVRDAARIIVRNNDTDIIANVGVFIILDGKEWFSISALLYEGVYKLMNMKLSNRESTSVPLICEFSSVLLYVEQIFQVLHS